jgi:RHS repeat-associated protein
MRNPAAADKAIEVPAQGVTTAAGAEARTARGPSPNSEPEPRNSGATSLPAIKLPTGGGAIRGIGEKFTANPASGTASLTIPIATTPGRAGFGPGLSLAYDSGSGNGSFGLGWSLSVPSVTRKVDKGVPEYRDTDESDTFIISGAEDLVRVPFHDSSDDQPRTEDGIEYTVWRYKPRVEGLFARIERWCNDSSGDVHFRATTRENVTSIYGKGTNARLSDPRASDKVFSWLLEETRDDRGNIARYEYKAEDLSGVDSEAPYEQHHFEVDDNGIPLAPATAQRYLKRVVYGNRVPFVADGWLFEVLFDYGEHADLLAPQAEVSPWGARRDAFSTYRSGFEIRTYRRCARVLMLHHFDELGGPCLVRSTEFQYAQAGEPDSFDLERPLVDPGDQTPGLTGEADEPTPPEAVGAPFSYLIGARQVGHERQGDGTYSRLELPRLEMRYQLPALFRGTFQLSPDAYDGVPAGVTAPRQQWIDLDGEGLPGILLDEGGVWWFKKNLGAGRFGKPSLLPAVPSQAKVARGQQLIDIDGDGQLELVQYHERLAWFVSRASGDEMWRALTYLKEFPNIDFNDPNLRFVDLTGDGFPDLLVTTDRAFVWHRCLGKRGFGAAQQVAKALTEREGPAVVFADAEQSVHLADMTGDGLVDIVRVRNGEVCYWPNLGNASFGAQVRMEVPGRFDETTRFDPRRVRWADLDGSGTSDLLYVDAQGVHVYFNEFGNAFTQPELIDSLPVESDGRQISAVDLFGRGTACLVWSSVLPADSAMPIRFVDMLGGVKPHVLKRYWNNLGAETELHYQPSTHYYLKDAELGRPWFTKLHFPVHVLDRMIARDRISHTELVTRYEYHHGYYDGIEREFRGFGRVDQWDAADFSEDSAFDGPVHPPSRTKTWFHTGAWLVEDLETSFASEYFDGRSDFLRSDTPALDLAEEIERQAVRAMRGLLLRQETYGEDESELEGLPYLVTEQSYDIIKLSDPDRSGHAVFWAHPKEKMTIAYERRLDDPRVSHEVVLQVDHFGNIVSTLQVAYPRRRDPQYGQGRILAIVNHHGFINVDEQAGWYRTGIPYESSRYELHGLESPSSNLLTLEVLEDALAGAAPLEYERAPTGGYQLRLFAQQRTLYREDALTATMDLGHVDSKALVERSYSLALTAGLVDGVLGTRVSDGDLQEAGFRRGRDLPFGTPTDAHWWAPSSASLYGSAASARQRFYQPSGVETARGAVHSVTYDSYACLVVEVQDPFSNTTTVNAGFSPAETAELWSQTYRFMKPAALRDPNENRSAVAQDALGFVSSLAIMGKPGAGEGDTRAAPTVVFEHNLLAFQLDQTPAYVESRKREQHGAANPRFQVSRTYSDGFGRIVQEKVEAEPGEAYRVVDATLEKSWTDERWVGTGRVIYDNKGQVVQSFEPFFCHTEEFEGDDELVRWGVSARLHYDPLGRLVRTDNPNSTFSRMEFSAWQQSSADENDTVLESDWYTARVALSPSSPEGRAARLSAAHANTPARSYLDPLSRTTLSIEDNGDLGQYATRVDYDIAGQQVSVTDAGGVQVLRQVFDLLGNVIFKESPDSGTNLNLADVSGNPVLSWGTGTLRTVNGLEDFERRMQRLFDPLERPTHVFEEMNGARHLVQRSYYADALNTGANGNLRLKPTLVFDGAGFVKTHTYDFKGNPLAMGRRLAAEYRTVPNWSIVDTSASATEAEADAVAAGLLDPLTNEYVQRSAYDALNRLGAELRPDGTVAHYTYNRANLLESVRYWEHTSINAAALEALALNYDAAVAGGPANWKTAVANIDYNARGQRERIELGPSGVDGTTAYSYYEDSFRLRHVTSTKGSKTLQNDWYTYDAVGNVVKIQRALRSKYDALGVVTGQRPIGATILQALGPELSASPDADYEYDAINRLVYATGRELPGIPTSRDERFDALPFSSDAAVEYQESYTYDEVGNLTLMRHIVAGDARSVWSREYQYEVVDGARVSNRLEVTVEHTYLGSFIGRYEHDRCGNMRRMPHLPELDWDYANRLIRTVKTVSSAPGEDATTYYAYDAAGQRVRKVAHKNGVIEERIYLGSFEIFRRHDGGARVASPGFERETFHILDDQRRVVLVERLTREGGAAVSRAPNAYFQFADQLGSTALELESGSDTPVSYEEYHPFGSTACQLSGGSRGSSRKRYRYNAKEHDEETGLHYYGARYYAAWLGRWTSSDPAGFVDGLGTYNANRDSPIVRNDPKGTASEDSWWSTTKEGIVGAQNWVQETALAAGEGVQDLGEGLIDVTGLENEYLKGGIRAGAMFLATQTSTSLEVAGGLAMIGPNALMGVTSAPERIGEGMHHVAEGAILQGTGEILEALGDVASAGLLVSGGVKAVQARMAAAEATAPAPPGEQVEVVKNPNTGKTPGTTYHRKTLQSVQAGEAGATPQTTKSKTTMKTTTTISSEGTVISRHTDAYGKHGGERARGVDAGRANRGPSLPDSFLPVSDVPGPSAPHYHQTGVPAIHSTKQSTIASQRRTALADAVPTSFVDTLYQLGLRL